MSFYGNGISGIINNNLENAFDNEDQSLNEAMLFISKDAKELKSKIKEIIKEEFKNDSSFGEKIKGAFNGKNKAFAKAAYQRALKRIAALVNGKVFGPCQRTRAYQAGYTTVYETYYVSSIYSILKNNKMIHIEYEYDSAFFSLSEYECNIPLDFVKEVLNITNSSYDLHINKKSIYAYSKSTIAKDKNYANTILELAQQKGINATLDLFKSTVVFK